MTWGHRKREDFGGRLSKPVDGTFANAKPIGEGNAAVIGEVYHFGSKNHSLWPVNSRDSLASNQTLAGHVESGFLRRPRVWSIL